MIKWVRVGVFEAGAPAGFFAEGCKPKG